MERKKGIDILLEKHNRIVNYLPENARYGMNPRLKEADEEDEMNNDELDFDLDQEGASEGNVEMADEPNMEAEPPDQGMNLGGEEGELDSLEIGDDLSADDGDFEDNLLPGQEDELQVTDTEDVPDEIDVTDFVEKSEDLTNKVDSQVNALNQQLQDLTNKISSMDQILNKLEKVEDEIHAMKPQKPIETLKLRSLDSYPYNQGIDDYWKKKEMEIEKLRDHNLSTQAEKYILTPEDIKNYSEVDIKKSFNPGAEEQTTFDRYQTDEREMGRFHGIQ